jgi:hypothetical protein
MTSLVMLRCITIQSPPLQGAGDRELCEAPPDGASPETDPRSGRGATLALAIVDTLPEPFLGPDDTLRLLAGSRCFEVFKEDLASPRRLLSYPMANGTSRLAPATRNRGSKAQCGRGLRFERTSSISAGAPSSNALPIRDDSGDSRMVLLAIKESPSVA